MGTRCLTFVHDESGMAIINMYRQFDGYPTGHGAELAEFLNSGSMVNGLRLGADEKFFNGMGCLAAQMVQQFKQGVGGIYLYPPKTGQNCWQEYEYHVFENKVIVKDPENVIFEGTWKEFYDFCLIGD